MSEQHTPGNQISAIEVQQYPEHFAGSRDRQGRAPCGDGPCELIPQGIEMKVDTAIASYVLSWVDPEDQQPEKPLLWPNVS